VQEQVRGRLAVLDHVARKDAVAEEAGEIDQVQLAMQEGELRRRGDATRLVRLSSIASAPSTGLSSSATRRRDSAFSFSKPASSSGSPVSRRIRPAYLMRQSVGRAP
jgi:ketosteroid isomerase-like protein